MPGGLDLLLLHAVLDGLRVDQLLQLLLLGDQQVVLVGGGLGGHLTRGVEHRTWIDCLCYLWCFLPILGDLMLI